MKKRFSKKLVSVITMMMLVLSLVGCGSAKKVNIEVSDNKVEVDVDDKVTVEIENYDELEDVNIEVEDDDIIKVKEKKGEITITGLEEGKTNIIITAANSDDEITIKVKVNAPAAPEPDPEPQQPEPQQPEPQQPEPQQPEPQQPEPQQPSSGSHTASDWFGDYHGTVYLYGSGAWSDQNLQYKCTAKVGTASGRDFFEVYSTEMDLWGGDWSGSNPVITFWVDITDDKMVCDTEVDAWVLDENDLSGESFYWYSYELDSYLTFSYDYWDPDYNGGFYVYIELYKD